MVYNAILGVGRDPQVTNDFVSDPSGVGFDLLPLMYVNDEGSGSTGQLLNVINPYFDYTNNTAFEWVVTTPQQNQVFGYALPKNCYIKNLSILYSLAITTSATVLIQVSEDGRTWQTIETRTTAATDRIATFEKLRFKFIRFDVTLTSSTFTLKRIELKSDPYQY